MLFCIKILHRTYKQDPNNNDNAYPILWKDLMNQALNNRDYNVLSLVQKEDEGNVNQLNIMKMIKRWQKFNTTINIRKQFWS